MLFCEYKDIFGKPGKGFHEKRFFGVAFNDFFGTILIALLISFVWNRSFLLTFLIIFILGVILHYLFCVPTSFALAIEKYLS